MPKQRSILGIDFRVASVKVVEIEKNKGKPVIKNWGMVEVPASLIDKHPEKETAQAEALKKLIREKKIRTKEASVVVGGSDVFVKIFNLTEVAKGEAHDAVKWKLAEEIPFPIEEAIFDFYSIIPDPEIGQGSDYVAACINSKTYHAIESIIKKAGLKLTSITIMPDVLHRVFEIDILKDKGKIISTIYMGKKTTNISILKDNRVVFNRELDIGGENITLAMSGVLISPEGRVEINPEAAEKIKVEHGIPIDVADYPKIGNIPISQLQAMVRPALAKVQDEIMRSFEYYKGQSGEAAIDKIILTGGSSITANLAKFLSEGLGIVIEAANVLEEMEIDPGVEAKEELKKNSPRLSAAIGAALEGGEKINLVPDQVKHRWEIAAQEFLKPQHVVSAYLILLTVFYLIFWGHALILKNVVAGINEKLVKHQPRIAALDMMEKTAKAEERRRLALRLYEEERTKIPLVFREISQIVSRNIIIRTVNVNQGELRVWGTAFEVGDTAENIMSNFVLALSASPYFSDVKMLKASKNNNYLQDAFNFEIIAKIVI